jgi:hypothetical protein
MRLVHDHVRGGPVTGFLPDSARCTAYWYAWRAHLLTGDGDLEFLRCLGLRAWDLARANAVPEWPKIAEGPFRVLLWPEWVWDIASRQMADDAARYGDYGPDPGYGGPEHGYWSTGHYG